MVSRKKIFLIVIDSGPSGATCSDYAGGISRQSIADILERAIHSISTGGIRTVVHSGGIPEQRRSRESEVLRAVEAVGVHSLRPDSTYEFTVTLSVSGTEIASPDTVAGKTNLPMIPLGLAVKDSSTSSVTLTWTPREYAVEYNIRHSSDAGTSWATLNDVKAAGSPNGFEVTGLTPGTAYQFQVRTEYSDKNKDDQPSIVFSEWSTSVSQSTVAIVAGAPTSAPVLTAVASSVEPTDAVLTWDSIPTADIGDGATSVTYEVQGLQTEIFPDPFPDPCTGDCWEPPDTAKLTVTHEGLTPGHLWYYRVRAKNDQDKTGPWSATKSVQLAGGAPAKPELTATVSGNTVILIWTEPDLGLISNHWV